MSEITIWQDAPSQTLAKAMAECRYGRRAPTSAEVAEAAEAARRIENEERITLPALIQFMRPFTILPNAPSPKELPAWAALCHMAVKALPASFLSPDLMAEGLRRWKFWPTPAEVFRLLDTWSFALTMQLMGLWEIARYVPPAPPPPPPPPPAPRVPPSAAEIAKWVDLWAERKRSHFSGYGRSQGDTIALLERECPEAIEIVYHGAELPGQRRQVRDPSDGSIVEVDTQERPANG